MSIDAKIVKVLRDKTGAGMMDCKKALVETKGNLDEAVDHLRKSGIAKAEKKGERIAKEGLVFSYIHHGGRLGVLVELNCETDFVARTDDFKNLAHDIAMQVAAMGPLYIDVDDVPDDESGDPQGLCLLQQPFIKDPAISIKDLVEQTIGKLGENVKIGKFTRFSLGE